MFGRAPTSGEECREFDAGGGTAGWSVRFVEDEHVRRVVAPAEVPTVVVGGGMDQGALDRHPMVPRSRYRPSPRRASEPRPAGTPPAGHGSTAVGWTWPLGRRDVEGWGAEGGRRDIAGTRCVGHQAHFPGRHDGSSAVGQEDNAPDTGTATPSGRTRARRQGRAARNRGRADRAPSTGWKASGAVRNPTLHR